MDIDYSTPQDDRPTSSDSLAQSAGSADSTTAATSTPSCVPEDDTSAASANQNEGNKRKVMSSPTVLPEQKRAKRVIDDPAAVTLFQEHGLPESFLTGGKCKAWVLQPTDQDYIRIHKYVENSQEAAFGVKILYIMRIIPRAHDAPVEFKNSNDPEIQGKHRKMLFHGTKKTNVHSILVKGLRLSQGTTPGIYFADRVTKSCFYTDKGYSDFKDGKQGYLFLCDVLLGKMNPDAPYGAVVAPPMKITYLDGTTELIPCESVIEEGMRIPDPAGNLEVDGCEWPMGPTINNWDNSNAYNEYSIYDAKQVQPKFLIKIEFTEAPYHPKLN